MTESELAKYRIVECIDRYLEHKSIATIDDIKGMVDILNVNIKHLLDNVTTLEELEDVRIFLFGKVK